MLRWVKAMVQQKSEATPFVRGQGFNCGNMSICRWWTGGPGRDYRLSCPSLHSWGVVLWTPLLPQAMAGVCSQHKGMQPRQFGVVSGVVSRSGAGTRLRVGLVDGIWIAARPCPLLAPPCPSSVGARPLRDGRVPMQFHLASTHTGSAQTVSFVSGPAAKRRHTRGCRNEKKKLGVSNTPYDGGWWVTDGGWCVTDGGWWVTDGGWWVATRHQRVDAIVKKRGGGGVLMAPPATHQCQAGKANARSQGQWEILQGAPLLDPPPRARPQGADTPRLHRRRPRQRNGWSPRAVVTAQGGACARGEGGGGGATPPPQEPSVQRAFGIESAPKHDRGLSLIRTFEKKNSFVHIRTFSYIFVHIRTYSYIFVHFRTYSYQRALKTPMNTPQNPSESVVQIGKIVISIIPTIRTFSYIFVPIRNSRFSSDSHFFVLFRTFSCTNGRQTLS